MIETGQPMIDSVAMYNLGTLYSHGDGVSQDYYQARQWHEKAVAAGHPDARPRLQELPNWLDFLRV
jgi:TPR repeat protein